MIWGIAAIAFLMQVLEAYRWKARVLLQFGGQLKLSAQTQAAFKDRDLVVINATALDLRKTFKIASPYTLILVGKDGGEKARWLTPIDPQIILNLIDSMPMRQSEMRRQNK